MRRSTRRAWLFLGFSTLAWPLYAHAPYEHPQATVTDPAGPRLQVVARYADGIIGADPVTVVIRDAAGVTVTETESARDAIVRCPSYDSCRVFLYEPPFSVFPQQVLRLGPSGFVTDTVDRYWVLGVLLPLWCHFPELLFESIALAVVPLVAQLLAGRRRTLFIIAAWCVFVPGAFAWLSFWLLGILLNTVVSVAWLALGVGSLAALPVVVRAASRRGLTMGWS